MTDDRLPPRPPLLRVVRDGETDPEVGLIQAVVDDVTVAHGHVEEARAEADELPGSTRILRENLAIADAALRGALAAADQYKEEQQR